MQAVVAKEMDMIDLDENDVIALLSDPNVIRFNIVQDQNGIEVENGILTQDSVVEINVDGDSKQLLKFLISTQYQCTQNNESFIHLKLMQQKNDLGDLVTHKLYVDMMDDLEITVNGKDPSEYILEWVELPHSYLAYSMTQALDGYINHIS